MDGCRAANVLGADVREAEAAHDAVRDEFRHGPDRLLDRDGGVRTVQEIEIDVVHREPT
jgi:hypothetical protein